MKPVLSVILPVHNEEEIIGHVLKEMLPSLKKLKIGFEILLVENGSRDDTYKVLKSLEKRYSNVYAVKTSKGYGSAVLKGFKKAKGENITYMPSDGQVDMSLFPKLWKEFLKGGHQIVKVKRSTRENFLRLVLSKLFSFILKIFFNTPLMDVNGSPRILKTSDMKKLGLLYKDSFIDAEMIIKAKDLGWKIKEIEMKNIERYGGKSTRSYKTYIEFVENILKYRLSYEKLN